MANKNQNLDFESAGASELNGLTDVNTGLPVSPTTADDGKLLFYDHAVNEFITDDAVTHGTVIINGKKSTAGTIAKGTPVYLVGFDSDLHTVEVADASSSATMPIIGLAAENMDNTNSKHITTFGKLTGVDTTATSALNPNGETWAVNDALYMSTTAGGFTKVRPTGGTTEIQRIAKVLKVDATGGQLFVFNTARTAGLPNLGTDKLWIGDANGIPQEVDKSTIGGASIYTQDGTIGSGRVATLTDTITFKGADNLSTSSNVKIQGLAGTDLWDFRNNGDVYLGVDSVITLNNTLKIEGGQTYIDSGSFNPLVINRKASGTLGNGIDFNAYNSSNIETNFARIVQVSTDVTAGSEDGGLWLRTMIGGTLRTPVILDNRELLVQGRYFTDNLFRVADNTIDVLRVSTSRQVHLRGAYNPLKLERTISGAGSSVNCDFDLHNSSSSLKNYSTIAGYIVDNTAGSEDGGFLFRTLKNGGLTTKLTILNDGVVIGDVGVYGAKVGTEDISLQGRTLVKGADTLSTSTAFEIYDGDTTPSKLWDFRNNGDVYVNQNSSYVLGNKTLTFDGSSSASNNVVDILGKTSGYAKFNNGAGLNISSGVSYHLRVTDQLFGYGTVFSIDTGLGGYWKSPSLALGGTASRIGFKILTGQDYEFYNSANARDVFYDLNTGTKQLLFLEQGFVRASGSVIFGSNAVISTEDISLQGETLIDGTLDMNNNRITNTVVNPSVQETTSTATLTINANQENTGVLTAQAVALTVANPTGTAVQGQKLVYRIKDNGTGRAITWGANFRAIGVTLPTTTTASKLLYVGCIYNITDSKWDVIAVNEEA